MFLNIDQHASNSIAILDNHDIVITYGELCAFSNQWKEIIVERSVVFILCENRAGALASYIAAIESNIIPLLLSANIDKKLLNQLIDIYTPMYICAPCNYEIPLTGKKILEKYEYQLVSTSFSLYQTYKELALLMTTSGSTGSPKLVRYKSSNLESNAKNVATIFGWTQDERPICDLPIQYTMGLNVINSHLWVGAKVLLTDYGLMSSAFWDFVKTQKATNFTGVPFSYDVLRKLRFTRMELPYLTTLAEGGGKLSEKVFKEYAEFALNTGKRFIATFGTTETAARLSYLEPQLAIDKIGSIGKAIPEGEMFLLNAQNVEITTNGVEGELVYKGPNVTLGYATSKEDLLREDDFKGEYRTGDIAIRDGDGCYYIVGRKSRFVKLFGHRISLDDCERIINQEFNVICACVGNDQLITIFLDKNDILEKVHIYISEKTHILKSAFNVIYHKDIPVNTAGKILYSKLIEYLK